MALSAPEPVAWMVYTLDGESVCVTDNPANFTSEHRALPLYTAPPQRKPLTDDEILDLYFDGFSISELIGFARAIERAHGIGSGKPSCTVTYVCPVCAASLERQE